MRTYLEARELAVGGQEAEFVRLDVTGKTQEEQDTILANLKDYMTGLTCSFAKHQCPHDTGGACCTYDLL
jgi:hypothetical protein